MRRIASCLLLATLFVSMFAFTLPFPFVHSVDWSGTVHIKPDGSIDPLTAPIALIFLRPAKSLWSMVVIPFLVT